MNRPKIFIVAAVWAESGRWSFSRVFLTREEAKKFIENHRRIPGWIKKQIIEVASNAPPS